MARPADLPSTEHFQQMPCGSRAKYSGAGCRCMLCRAANSRYETMRAAARKRGEWNGLVSADDVRAHLKQLSKLGVGYKSVAAAADISATSLSEIIAGRKHQLRALAARRVLAVDRDALADSALVHAGPTWRRIRRLLAEGFTKTELARRLGSKARTPTLQLRRRQVLAKTAARVERFYQRVMVA